MHSGQPDTGRGISPDGLSKDSASSAARKLSSQLLMSAVNSHDSMGAIVKDRTDSCEGFLEHRPGACDVQELFWQLLTALRPESRAGSPGHDNKEHSNPLNSPNALNTPDHQNSPSYSPPKIILQPHDVVFAQVWAELDLYKGEHVIPDVFDTMSRSDRYVDGST